MDKRGGGNQDFPPKNFFLTVQKIFVGESFTVALISGTEKIWRGGGYQDSTSKMVCLTVPKYFLGESFTVALISGTEKVWRRRGGIKILRRNFFVSLCRKSP